MAKPINPTLVYVGKPCKHGHSGLRWISEHDCVECRRIRKRNRKSPLLQGRWWNIKQRCYNPNNPDYKHYGARGITMCDRWRRSLAAFVADVGLPPSPKAEIDRINNDGNYEPGNVRWASRTTQIRNCRATKLTIEDVRYIRSHFIRGHTNRKDGNSAELAARFNVSRSQICQIARVRNWQKV